MSDHVVPNPDAEAERLEAALERIAALARRPPLAPPTAPSEPDTTREQAAAELDGLISKLRERLGEFEEPAQPTVGGDEEPPVAGTVTAGVAGDGI